MNYHDFQAVQQGAKPFERLPQPMPAADDPMVQAIRAAAFAHATGIEVQEEPCLRLVKG